MNTINQISENERRKPLLKRLSMRPIVENELRESPSIQTILKIISRQLFLDTGNNPE